MPGGVRHGDVQTGEGEDGQPAAATDAGGGLRVDDDDDGADLRTHLEEDRRTVYLGPEADNPSLERLIEEFWEEIFELELAAWLEDSSGWPAPRTREMFNEWFEVELTDTVVDLVPEEPLTQQQLDAAEVGLVGPGPVRTGGYSGVHLGFAQRQARQQRGQAEVPPIAIVTNSGDLDRDSLVFTNTEVRPLIL